MPGRALSPSEALFADIRSTVGYSVLGTGRIHVAAMAVAFEALQRRYPVLSGRIGLGDDGSPRLELRTPDAGCVRCGDGTDPPAGAAAVLGADEVSAVDVAQQDNNFRLTLLTHHSIADAAASLRYLQVLCGLYTKTVRAGSPGRIRAHPLPRSIEDVLGLHPAAAGPCFLPAGEEPAVMHRDRLQLSGTQTRTLLDHGRRHGLTAHGAAAAGMLLAAHAASGESGPVPFTFVSAVNLRRRLTPAVTPEGGTVIVGSDYAPVSIDPAADPYASGRAVLTSIASGLASGDIHRSLSVHGLGVPGENVIHVTNWGTIPRLYFPPGITPRDFRASACGLRSEHAPTRPRAVLSAIVTTFRGRLSLDIPSRTDGTPTAGQLRSAFGRLIAE